MLELEGKSIGSQQVGIPIPPRPGGRGSVERLSIEELLPNGSRVFKGYTSKKLVQICASIRKKFPDRKFVVRTIGDTGLIVRVWREK